MGERRKRQRGENIKLGPVQGAVCGTALKSKFFLAGKNQSGVDESSVADSHAPKTSETPRARRQVALLLSQAAPAQNIDVTAGESKRAGNMR